jgi:phage tail protein X
MSITYSTQEGDRLDLICYRQYGTLRGRVLEQVMEANPDLAQQPLSLPADIVINFPDLSNSISEREYISLGFY